MKNYTEEKLDSKPVASINARHENKTMLRLPGPDAPIGNFTNEHQRDHRRITQLIPVNHQSHNTFCKLLYFKPLSFVVTVFVVTHD